MRKGLKPSRRHFLAVAAGSVISPRVVLAQSPTASRVSHRLVAPGAGLRFCGHEREGLLQ